MKTIRLGLVVLALILFGVPADAQTSDTVTVYTVTGGSVAVPAGATRQDACSNYLRGWLIYVGIDSANWTRYGAVVFGSSCELYIDGAYNATFGVIIESIIPRADLGLDQPAGTDATVKVYSMNTLNAGAAASAEQACVNAFNAWAAQTGGSAATSYSTRVVGDSCYLTQLDGSIIWSFGTITVGDIARSAFGSSSAPPTGGGVSDASVTRASAFLFLFGVCFCFCSGWVAGQQR